MHVLTHIHTYTCGQICHFIVFWWLGQVNGGWGGLGEQSAGKQTRKGQHWMKEGLGEEVERRAAQIHGFDICVLLDWLLTAPFVTPLPSTPACPPHLFLHLHFASSKPLPLPTLRPHLLLLVRCESEEAQSVEGWIRDVLWRDNKLPIRQLQQWPLKVLQPKTSSTPAKRRTKKQTNKQKIVKK